MTEQGKALWLKVHATTASVALGALMCELASSREEWEELDGETRRLYHEAAHTRKVLEQNILKTRGDREEDMGRFSWVERALREREEG